MICHLFSFYLHMWSSPTQRMLHTIFCFTYSRVCRGNLPHKFAMSICHRNLPWLFAVGILSFVFVSKSFLVYGNKSFLYESKPFSYVSKTFLFVIFSLLTVFLFVIAVVVLAHINICMHVNKCHVNKFTLSTVISTRKEWYLSVDVCYELLAKHVT